MAKQASPQMWTTWGQILRRIEGKLDESLKNDKRILNAFKRKEKQIMATLDDLLAEMERDTSVSDGILAMLEKLQADIQAAGGNQAKIDAVFAGFKSNTDKLAAKLVVNTPVGSTGAVV